MWRQGGACALLAAFLAVAMAGCAQTRLAVHALQEIGRQSAKPAAPAYEGAYKVGAPYQANGEWYFPKVEPDYDETGVASWYGREFHGRPTANGETFDMHAVSAAHPTLPLPTWVRITNLENGRSLVVRVNDRGPFVDNRIIDLSFRAAQLLGFATTGLARTRVEALPGPEGGAVAAAGAARGWLGDAGLYVQAGRVPVRPGRARSPHGACVPGERHRDHRRRKRPPALSGARGAARRPAPRGRDAGDGSGARVSRGPDRRRVNRGILA